jgi:hypothetical protein
MPRSDEYNHLYHNNGLENILDKFIESGTIRSAKKILEHNKDTFIYYGKYMAKIERYEANNGNKQDYIR